MPRRSKMVLATLVAAMAIAGVYLGVPMEGDGDLRPSNPDPSNYVGSLIHSRDQYDQSVWLPWERHLHAWVLVRRPDGGLERQPIVSSVDWFCIKGQKSGTNVAQLPDSVLKHIPLGPPAQCHP